MASDDDVADRLRKLRGKPKPLTVEVDGIQYEEVEYVPIEPPDYELFTTLVPTSPPSFNAKLKLTPKEDTAEAQERFIRSVQSYLTTLIEEPEDGIE